MASRFLTFLSLPCSRLRRIVHRAPQLHYFSVRVSFRGGGWKAPRTRENPYEQAEEIRGRRASSTSLSFKHASLGRSNALTNPHTSLLLVFDFFFRFFIFFYLFFFSSFFLLPSLGLVPKPERFT